MRYCLHVFTRRLAFRLLAFCLVLLHLCSLSAQRVINSGVPGQNTAEIAARTDAVLQSVRPDFVVLFAGMNDAVNEKKFLSSQQARENILSIIRKAEKARAVVVLVNVHHPDDLRLLARHDPRVYGGRSPSMRVDEVNRVILEMAREQTLTVADFRGALEEAGGANLSLSTDGVHLTSRGYSLLARTVRAALPMEPGALRGKTVLCLGDSITYGIGVRAADAPEDGTDTYPAQLQRLLAAGEAAR